MDTEVQGGNPLGDRMMAHTRDIELAREVEAAIGIPAERLVADLAVIERDYLCRLAQEIEDAFEVASKTEDADALVEIMVKVRGRLRKSRHYDIADCIRSGLSELGVQIKDTPQGTRWHYDSGDPQDSRSRHSQNEEEWESLLEKVRKRRENGKFS